MGGSDQWGNIVNGVELGRRIDGTRLFGLTTPLLTTASGEKMGKTVGGAVWVNDDRLPAFDYWQYWRNAQDADVGRFLRLFTELPIEEIERLERLEGAELNEAKKVLASEATRLCRGEAAASEAETAARAQFETGDSASGLPVVELDRIVQGMPLIELLHRAGLASSNSEARRLIRGGGARLNDDAIDSETATLDAADLRDGTVKLSAGKKRHVLVRAV
jgi:tyrosyl-tRNA synthetase